MPLEYAPYLYRLFAAWHEPWMEAEHRAAADEEAMEAYGEQFDAFIRKGVEQGFTPTHQARLLWDLILEGVIPPPQ